MSEFVFGQRSLDRLNGVNTRLVSVVHRALELSTVDFTVVEGLRSKQRQTQLLHILPNAPAVDFEQLKQLWIAQSEHHVQI